MSEDQPKIDIKAKLEETRKMLERMQQQGKERREHFQKLVESAKRGTPPPPRPEWMKKKETPAPKRIPDLDARLKATRELTERVHQLSDRKKQLLRELQQNPLEQQCDAVYEETGRKLLKLEQEELDDVSSFDEELERGERDAAEEEKLEEAGQPPPTSRR